MQIRKQKVNFEAPLTIARYESDARAHRLVYIKRQFQNKGENERSLRFHTNLSLRCFDPRNRPRRLVLPRFKRIKRNIDKRQARYIFV